MYFYIHFRFPCDTFLCKRSLDAQLYPFPPSLIPLRALNRTIYQSPFSSLSQSQITSDCVHIRTYRPINRSLTNPDANPRDFSQAKLLSHPLLALRTASWWNRI